MYDGIFLKKLSLEENLGIVSVATIVWLIICQIKFMIYMKPILLSSFGHHNFPILPSASLCLVDSSSTKTLQWYLLIFGKFQKKTENLTYIGSA